MSKLHVFGDLAIDWFHFDMEHKKSNEHSFNFQNYKAQNFVLKTGGAFFLKELLAEKNIECNGPEIDENSMLDKLSNGLLRSHVYMQRKNKVWRIEQFRGYNQVVSQDINQYYSRQTIESGDLVIVDDANNGFTSNVKVPESIGKAKTILYKIGSRVDEAFISNKWWKRIVNDCSDKLVVLINIDDLRRSEQVQISRAISWERTAREVLFALFKSKSLRSLHRANTVVVQIDMEGALIIRREKDIYQVELIYTPDALEGQKRVDYPGHVIGKTSFLLSGIAKALHKGALLREGVTEGLSNCFKHQVCGYSLDFPEEIPQITLNFFNSDLNKDIKIDYSFINVPLPSSLNNPDPEFWRIVDEKYKDTYLEKAREVCLSGIKKLKGVPKIKINALTTFDRRETEQLGAIRHLIEEYLSTAKVKQPLSFAVFGSPGSGKSFAVEQIAESIDIRGAALSKVVFNLSQFKSEDELNEAFQIIRDISLKGKVPFVFFDEFDSNELEWLKHFLAPMNDNEFKHGELTHPLGSRSIFVFAGGTSHTFTEFDKSQSGDEKLKKFFISKKGPDFVSRLKGFINIMGINRSSDNDPYFVLRRANLLNVSLHMDKSASGLFRDNVLQIDPGVLRAFLFVPRFKHGMRSLKSIIAMSRLEGKSEFTKGCLPTREQLNMHVDADDFMYLVERERYTTMSPEFINHYAGGESTGIKQHEEAFNEKLSRKIWEYYDINREIKLDKGDEINEFRTEDIERFISREQLNNQFKLSNDDACADLPCKLKELGLRLELQNNTAAIYDFLVEELIEYGRLEHSRWIMERKLQGWKEDKDRNLNRHLKITNCFVDYDQLPDRGIKDIEQMYALLRFLKEGQQYTLVRNQEFTSDTATIHELVNKLFEKAMNCIYVTDLLPHPEVTSIKQLNNVSEDELKELISKLEKNVEFLRAYARSMWLFSDRNKPDSHKLKEFIYCCWVNHQVVVKDKIPILRGQEHKKNEMPDSNHKKWITGLKQEDIVTVVINPELKKLSGIENDLLEALLQCLTEG